MQAGLEFFRQANHAPEMPCQRHHSFRLFQAKEALLVVAQHAHRPRVAADIEADGGESGIAFPQIKLVVVRQALAFLVRRKLMLEDNRRIRPLKKRPTTLGPVVAVVPAAGDEIRQKILIGFRTGNRCRIAVQVLRVEHDRGRIHGHAHTVQSRTPGIRRRYSLVASVQRAFDVILIHDAFSPLQADNSLSLTSPSPAYRASKAHSALWLRTPVFWNTTFVR